MYEKRFSRELIDTTVGDRCILVDGNLFIRTSKMFMFACIRILMKMKNEKDQKIQRSEGKHNKR